MMSVSVVTLLVLLACCFADATPIVDLPLGTIEGHYLVSGSGAKYKAFEGIPYAEPPLKDKRFRSPVPVQPWSSKLLAKKLKGPCLSFLLKKESGSYVTGVEDCLYLNVYAPNKTYDAPLPVIFWIHGGAFQFSMVGGTEQKYLIDHDVIFVSTSYRLGSLGFLSTEDEVVPGNMGLKDQALALRWVSENIKYFGGDPKKVTITGLSAGGVSVHYHYLSPASAGLFRSGISFSGAALDSWALAENSRDKAIRMAEIVNCTNSDIRQMIECLRDRPARDLVEAQINFRPTIFSTLDPFGPVVEKHSKDPFIDRSPIEIIASGGAYDVPWITGVVSEDGLYDTAEFATNASAFDDLDKHWESLAPELLDYYYTIPKDKHGEVANKIRKHYFGDETIGQKNMFTLTKMVSDRIFFIGTELSARLQAKANTAPVFLFYYSYNSQPSVTEYLSGSTENMGVCHGDDAYLVLDSVYKKPTHSRKDLAMRNDLIGFWISVAYDRVPSYMTQWQRVDPNSTNANYLHIAGPGSYITKTDDFAQKQFWNSIDFEENRLPST